ncbi:MAG: lipase family protein [Gammaproteobacteria bacterium AqS3]|nr:lipase family protein [Gammaproteobacteria bacterium AqS3]
MTSHDEKQTKKVNPYKTNLDPGNAYWMARLAREAYRSKSDEDNSPDEDKILKSLKGDDSGFLKVIGFSHKSSQAILVEHKKYYCMAFRGTDEIKDWLDNMNLAVSEELFGEFHTGFWKATQDIWDDIFGKYEALKKVSLRPKPMFFTGHSLGGAMASVAAAIFIEEDIPFTSCYTFGQPRVVRRETSRVMNNECQSRFFRFHNNNDIVARIPQRLMGYSHFGTYLYIDTDMEICLDGVGFWYRFMDSVQGFIDDIGEMGLDAIEDHDINEYLEAVERWCFKD